MLKCPTEIQLTLFIEGKLTKQEAIKIRQHIAKCQHCSHMLADLLKLQDLELEGLLPQVTQQEADSAFQALERLMQNKTKSLPTIIEIKNSYQKESKSEFNGFLGVIMSAAGLSEIPKNPDRSSLNPSFAGNNEKDFSPSVRIQEIFSSQSLEETNSPDTELDQEVENVDNNNMNTKVKPAHTVFGIPGYEGQSSFVQQGYEDTCAIRCQELILRDFGVNVSEDVLVNQAIERGWYSPGGGTSPNDVGNLLELHGVEVNRYENANIFTLTNELAKGNRVVIGVDSGELWNRGLFERLEDLMGIQEADHALIVSGIDTSDPNNVKVILTDPGSGDIAKEYPMEQFIDAWKDSNFFMVTTVEPAPLAFNPEMVNFDYAQGHLSEIGHLSYGDFQELFSPYLDLELELAESLLSNQTEIFSKMVNQDDLVAENYTVTPDEPMIDDYLEPLSETMEPNFDFGGEDLPSNDEYDSLEDDDDWDDGDNFDDNLFT